MPISDLPIVSMLRSRMQWHQERQRVLAENVANADTPNFRPRDLVTPDFSRVLAATAGPVGLAQTDRGHQSATLAAETFGINRNTGYETRPAGNAVNLEDEMMKVASNQMDYQAAASLYSRSLALIKMALGK